MFNFNHSPSCMCYRCLADIKLLKGGDGSGNFGHAGRPGEVGGSGAGGSFEKEGQIREQRLREAVEYVRNKDAVMKDIYEESHQLKNAAKEYSDMGDTPIKQVLSKAMNGTLDYKNISMHDATLLFEGAALYEATQTNDYNGSVQREVTPVEVAGEVQRIISNADPITQLKEGDEGRFTDVASFTKANYVAGEHAGVFKPNPNVSIMVMHEPIKGLDMEPYAPPYFKDEREVLLSGPYQVDSIDHANRTIYVSRPNGLTKSD